MGEPENLKTDGVELRPCAKCRCPLAIVMGPNGKKIPLDLRTQVYTVTRDALGNPTAAPMPDAHPTHFATCAHASSFGGGKKR
jgi:hypothetical protein